MTEERGRKRDVKGERGRERRKCERKEGEEKSSG